MCQSMVGLMTLYLDSARVSDEGENELAEAAYGVIRTGMESGTYAKGAIRSLAFIGDRSTIAPTNATVLATTPPVTVSNDIVVVASPETDANISIATAPPETTAAPDDPLLEPELIPSTSQGTDLNASITTASPGRPAPTDESVLVPESKPIIDSENVVVAVSKGESIENNGESLGGTKIGLISAASAFLVVVALVGLLLSKKRRRVETFDEDDGVLDGSRSVSSKGSPQRKRTIVPQLVSQWSREGAEIPGSLASQDAMALKPQYRRSDDDSYASSDSDNEEASPQTPPRINNLASQEASSPQGPTSDAGVVRSPVPLSPVKNSKSGTSPSQVSPKRLPASLNAPFVSSRGARTSRMDHHHSVIEEPSQSISILDQLVAEIDAETGTPERNRGSTTETLRRIADDDSTSTACFQDAVSGDSTHYPSNSVNL